MMHPRETTSKIPVNLMGRLIDNRDERAYQHAQSPATRKRMRFVCILTGMAYLAAIYADSTQLGHEDLMQMIVVRCLAVALAVPPIIHSFSKTMSTFRFGLYVCLYMVGMMVGEIAELIIKAGHVTLPETPITVYMVLLFYLFLPPHLWQSLIAGGLGTIAYLATLAFILDAPSAYVANTALIFALSNAFGLYFCIRFGAAQRQEYLARAELQRMAEIDDLTGVYNRRRVMNLGMREIHASQRYGHPCSAMTLDIDHFKAINDTYGHAAGDAVLVNLASVSCQCLREVDLFGRIGGEEFVAFLPNTSCEQATTVAERLRQKIEETPFIISGVTINVTISIGVAELAESVSTMDALMWTADTALYKAKQGGRNRVVMANVQVPSRIHVASS